VNLFAIALVYALLGAPSANTPHGCLRTRAKRPPASGGALHRRPGRPLPALRRGLPHLRHDRLRSFYGEWEETLDRTDYDGLNLQGKIDYQLLLNRLRYEVRRLDLDRESYQEALAPLPFLPALIGLHETRRTLDPVNPREAARVLNEVTASIHEIRRSLEAGLSREGNTGLVSPVVARRAVVRTGEIQRAISEWFAFYHGFDPLFTWWVSQPYETFQRALAGYVAFLRDGVAGIEEGTEGDIIGDPIGEAALLLDLEAELIPYTPPSSSASPSGSWPGGWGRCAEPPGSWDMGMTGTPPWST
jgi:hypothetical protein